MEQAIQDVTLQELLHEEPVQAGDIIFVPAGTVHAIGSGVLLYELQEYSDVTYRMYDYGRLTASGKPRELHIRQSLDVAHYTPPLEVKVQPVPLSTAHDLPDRCLVACRYFLTREIQLQENLQLHGVTDSSCIILTCLGDEAQVFYGERGTRVEYIHIQGQGALLFSYVPEPSDVAWQLWREKNSTYGD